jgi:ArsR family transcriptional regulator
MSLTPLSLFKCLSDETRLRIVLMLTGEQELCVCELIAALDDSQPKISRHLAMLRACGLLADRRQGQWIYYRLHPELPDWASSILQQTSIADGERLGADTLRLAAMLARPQRQAMCS